MEHADVGQDDDALLGPERPQDVSGQAPVHRVPRQRRLVVCRGVLVLLAAPPARAPPGTRAAGPAFWAFGASAASDPASSSSGRAPRRTRGSGTAVVLNNTAHDARSSYQPRQCALRVRDRATSPAGRLCKSHVNFARFYTRDVGGGPHVCALAVCRKTGPAAECELGCVLSPLAFATGAFSSPCRTYDRRM